MTLPQEFLDSLEGVAGFHRASFVAVHAENEGLTSVRINPAKPPDDWPAESSPLQPVDSPAITIHDTSATPVPWAGSGYYLSRRPSFTFDPLFHAGAYYVQEASSMFLEQALTQLAPLQVPLKVLDLCGAPGGKSTHLQTLLHPGSLLVSNEVIRQRSLVLMDNIIRWGCSNVMVTNNDPRAFRSMPGFFDVMVVDAPCSGSGMFRKDPDAISEWSLQNVALCSQRQQRILADALPGLKEDGLLIYATCSYSEAEDETIMDWLVNEMNLQSLPLTINPDWNIVVTTTATGASGYRFYPDRLRGEGFFLACFRKKEANAVFKPKAVKPNLVSRKEKEIASAWLNADDHEMLRFREGVIALPADLVNDFLVINAHTNLQYAGVALGEIMKERLVPAHPLSQHNLLAQTLPAFDLDYGNAVRYLQRLDLLVQPEHIGWQTVRYRNKPLGWINALKNRVNNYYPKEMRILKQNNTPFAK